MNTNKGGYFLSKDESKKVIDVTIEISDKINIAVEKFTKTKLPKLRAEYFNLINKGTPNQEAFDIIRSKILS